MSESHCQSKDQVNEESLDKNQTSIKSSSEVLSTKMNRRDSVKKPKTPGKVSLEEKSMKN